MTAAARNSSRKRRLRRRSHDAFWMPDEGFYAMAIGPDKEQVRSIGSNAGHAIPAGLAPAAEARRCADRLMAGDLFSGWGVRTLSADHPSYNPLCRAHVWSIAGSVAWRKCKGPGPRGRRRARVERVVGNQCFDFGGRQEQPRRRLLSEPSKSRDVGGRRRYIPVEIDGTRIRVLWRSHATSPRGQRVRNSLELPRDPRRRCAADSRCPQDPATFAPARP